MNERLTSRIVRHDLPTPPPPTTTSLYSIIRWTKCDFTALCGAISVSQHHYNSYSKLLDRFLPSQDGVRCATVPLAASRQSLPDIRAVSLWPLFTVQACNLYPAVITLSVSRETRLREQLE